MADIRPQESDIREKYERAVIIEPPFDDGDNDDKEKKSSDRLSKALDAAISADSDSEDELDVSDSMSRVLTVLAEHGY